MKQSRKPVPSHLVGTERKLTARRLVRMFTVLLGVVVRRDPICQYGDNRDRRKSNHANQPEPSHDLRNGSRATRTSEIRLTNTVTAVSNRTTVTNTGKSRASAAFHASCPMPAT